MSTVFHLHLNVEIETTAEEKKDLQLTSKSG